MMRTITAMFSERSRAEAAVAELTRDLGTGANQVQVHAADTAVPSTATASTTAGEGGFWSSLKELFVPDEDRHTYAEGVRRGNVVVSATVDEDRLDHAMDILENHGAVDLDSQEAEWRQEGWTTDQTPTRTTTDALVASSPSTPELGLTSNDAASGAPARAATSTSTNQSSAPAPSAREGHEEVIPIVEEQVRIGKRDVERGRVRVRSYIVETPVTEQVTLRQEHVDVERRTVDRPVTDADRMFEDRTIEATEHSEEAVIGKETRITEEIVIRKDARQRTETVQDTVRHTEVEVDDTTGISDAATAQTSSMNSALDASGSSLNPKR
jgi:uncharacterized protein (TIGR02271 family)